MNEPNEPTYDGRDGTLEDGDGEAYISACDGEIVPELTTCHHCHGTHTVAGEEEMLCRDCGKWSPCLDHAAGCFYGSFADAYPAVWHVPAGAKCDLPHGNDAIYLEVAKS